jgi:hypothetical protein
MDLILDALRWHFGTRGRWRFNIRTNGWTCLLSAARYAVANRVGRLVRVFAHALNQAVLKRNSQLIDLAVSQTQLIREFLYSRRQFSCEAFSRAMMVPPCVVFSITCGPFWKVDGDSTWRPCFLTSFIVE